MCVMVRLSLRDGTRGCNTRRYLRYATINLASCEILGKKYVWPQFLMNAKTIDRMSALTAGPGIHASHVRCFDRGTSRASAAPAFKRSPIPSTHPMHGTSHNHYRNICGIFYISFLLPPSNPRQLDISPQTLHGSHGITQ